MEAIELPQTLMGGTRAMRKAGKKYLPQEPGEENQAYEHRLAKSTLYNSFKKTVHSMVGKPFGVPITLGTDIPAEIVPWLEDVDRQGRDLDTFARDVFRQCLVDGIGFILVDYPVVKATLNLAEERALGLRPFWVHVQAKQVIGWKAQNVNGRMVLTQVRIKECVDVPDGEFGTTSRDQIRVLEPGSVRVFVQNAKHEWVIDPELSGPTTLDFIPLIPCYTGRTGFMTATPPLEDLAWLCCDHWQSKSDQKHILHVARVPLLFARKLQNATNTPVVVGPNRLINSDQADADLKYVEHTGKAIEAGRQDLTDTEDMMRRVAGELLTSDVQKTATEAGQETREGESSLKAMVRTFEDALEQALLFTAAWIKLPSGGSLKVNREWREDTVDPQELAVMLQAVVQGKITLKAWVLYLVEKELLPPDTDVDAEVETLKLEAEQPLPFKTPIVPGDPGTTAA
ncbi:DUF4055 domain-containing protein [Mesoterricola silvestris]|nr:DUF4055 domain-containing protein [Mesoterricola silvestris]